MDEKIFTDAEHRYFGEQRVGRPATAQPNGTLQNNPVGFSCNPPTLRTIDIGGRDMPGTQKFKWHA